MEQSGHGAPPCRVWGPQRLLRRPETEHCVTMEVWEEAAREAKQVEEAVRNWPKLPVSTALPLAPAGHLGSEQRRLGLGTGAWAGVGSPRPPDMEAMRKGGP